MKQMSNEEIMQALLDLNGEVKEIEIAFNKAISHFYKETANMIAELNRREEDREE